ncbi:hypothetical protein [Flavobacterium limnophilum]|uniref:hypothetical protein n=1 Tax=Flavobacterium limnophilum TaxID=3003262 RepID=UPI0022AC0992|nr:hypothetical protein [Flavobacterium limnophilum]
MTKLEETLTILDFYGKRIKGKNDFLLKNKSFDLGACIKENLSLGKSTNETSIICKDKIVQIHTYFSMNIIDLTSFIDEYDNKFDITVTENKIIAKRINNFKVENKNLKKKINWNKLKNIRNTVFAHNLRNKNNNYRLSINELFEANSMFNNLNDFTSMIICFNEFFDQFQNEFQDEIKIGYESFKSEYEKLKLEKKQR